MACLRPKLPQCEVKTLSNFRHRAGLTNRSIRVLPHDPVRPPLNVFARCRVYLFYLVCVKRLPSVLRFRSTPSDSATLLLDSELQLRERIKELERSRQDLSAMECLESVLLGNILTFNTALHISFAAHPQHPPNVAKGMPILLNPFADGISDLSARLVLPATKLYLDRLAVELRLAKDSPESQSESQSLLEQLQVAYDAAADLNGMANCLLIKADGVASPPFTSPLAMNLIAVIKVSK